MNLNFNYYYIFILLVSSSPLIGMENDQKSLNNQLLEALNFDRMNALQCQDRKANIENYCKGIEDLLSSGADVNTYDENQYTPLHHEIITSYLINSQDTNILEALYRHNPNINQADDEGYTFLQRAILVENNNALRKLLELIDEDTKITINKKNLYNSLYDFAFTTDHLEALKILEPYHQNIPHTSTGTLTTYEAYKHNVQEYDEQQGESFYFLSVNDLEEFYSSESIFLSGCGEHYRAGSDGGTLIEEKALEENRHLRVYVEDSRYASFSNKDKTGFLWSLPFRIEISPGIGKLYVYMPFHHPEPYGLLIGLGIEPAYRRKGYARKLLSKAYEIIRNCDIGKAKLSVDRGESNNEAIKLYTSEGFVHDPNCITEYVMTKNLK